MNTTDWTLWIPWQPRGQQMVLNEYSKLAGMVVVLVGQVAYEGEGGPELAFRFHLFAN